MCGIFGYIGNRTNASKIVFEGLKRLEYRGYDSWGIVAKATSDKQHVTGNKLLIEKHVGKIGNSHLTLATHHSSLALGHTRWATHGGVTKANAHPHLDCGGTIAVVHNGIVENYLELKKSLTKKHRFLSETDTEVIAHMIEEELKEVPLRIAIQKVFNRLSGLNAVVVLSKDSLVAAKNGSPLVLGISPGSFYIASDASALLPYSKKVIFMGDGQLAQINDSSLILFDLKKGSRLAPKVQELNWNLQDAQLGKYKHFMLKEIYEQPRVVANIAENYSEHVKKLCDYINQSRGIFLIGAGTAYHACLAGSYLFSKINKMHVNTLVASEFNYLEDFLNKKSLVIALSQSGETIDVIEPLKRAQEKGSSIVGLVNNVGSTIWRMADLKIPLSAGPEIAVASTKAYIAKLSILFLTAYDLSGKLKEGQRLLIQASKEIERLLFEEMANIKKISKMLRTCEHVFTIGRGFSYQLALEAALKMKEVSYIHSEGLAGGELKHGPIALISKNTPCIVFAPSDETFGAIISNAAEIKARGGKIIGISPLPHQVFDYFVKVKDLREASIIPSVIPAQLCGYLMAIEKGLDPDKPRNLAKSVTVK